jgi:hypothetical protein
MQEGRKGGAGLCVFILIFIIEIDSLTLPVDPLRAVSGHVVADRAHPSSRQPALGAIAKWLDFSKPQSCSGIALENPC